MAHVSKTEIDVRDVTMPGEIPRCLVTSSEPPIRNLSTISARQLRDQYLEQVNVCSIPPPANIASGADVRNQSVASSHVQPLQLPIHTHSFEELPGEVVYDRNFMPWYQLNRLPGVLSKASDSPPPFLHE
jgi:hypothetical protein